MASPHRVRPLRHGHPGPRGPGRRGRLRLLPLQVAAGHLPAGGDCFAGPLEAGAGAAPGRQGRRYLITLEPGATFHTHKGRLARDQPDRRSAEAQRDLGKKRKCRGLLADGGREVPARARSLYPRPRRLMTVAAGRPTGATVVEAGAIQGPVDRPAPGARPRRGCTPSSAGRTSPTRPGATSSAGSASPPTATSCTPATSSRASLGSGPSTGSCSTCWSRGWSLPGAAAALHPGGVLVLPGHRAPGDAPGRGAGVLQAASAWSRPRRPSSAPGTSTAWPSAPSTAWSAATSLVSARRSTGPGRWAGIEAGLRRR